MQESGRNIYFFAFDLKKYFEEYYNKYLIATSSFIVNK